MPYGPSARRICDLADFLLLLCGQGVFEEMKSTEHRKHIAENISHARCSECRADTERRFVGGWPFRYGFVHEYLTWVRPRLEAIRNGEQSTNARIWHRDFIKALNTRISSHLPANGRKHSHSYLERFRQWRGMSVDAGYLRQFASRGASALDW
jgi:hypothetical protein